MQTLLKPWLLKTASYIDGQWQSNGRQFDVLNPFDDSTVATVYDADAALADLAILAAERALKTWSKKTAKQRADSLRVWRDLMMEHQNDLAHILTLEQGKPLSEAKAEISYGASYLEWFSEEAKRLYGDTIPSNHHSQRIMVLKQPVGVVTAITPWNFPNAMIARKAAAALAAGCTFVVRPSELTPLSALAMAELAEQAGIPKGVFNVIVGTDASAIGKVLTQHPAVAKFTFTGSTKVGKQLISQCAQGVKKVSMELGGNAPFIVFEDADLDLAVAGLMSSKFRNAGQTCVCTNRILVHQSIASKFTEKLLAEVQTLKIGSGLDSQTQIGPLINRNACIKIKNWLDESVRLGASLMYGGEILDCKFFTPTIVEDVNPAMPIARNEIFGPVAPILTFSNESEAIEIANNTEYGLAGYFYSENIKRIWRVAEALQFGMLGINEGVISNPAAPFGGIKQSGNGREGSKYGLDDYVETKYLCLGGLD